MDSLGTAWSSVELIETPSAVVVAIFGFGEGEVSRCPAAFAGFPVSRDLG
jgi:hypothetical protein